ncbi:MAG: ATP-binding protein [Oligoflexia bacterium]|nr:ATP-binding protein [Oligoflexia bacterium]
MYFRRSWLEYPLIYLVCLVFGAKYSATVDGAAAAFWPASGAALAAFVSFGPRAFLPGAALALAGRAMTTDLPTGFVLAVAAADFLEAVAARALFRRFVSREGCLGTYREVLRFLLFVAPASTIVGSLGSAAALRLADAVARGEARDIWLLEWTGRTLGAVVIFPLIRSWSEGIAPGRRMEFLSWVAAIFLVCLGSFLDFQLAWAPGLGTWIAQPYTLFACLAGFALRFDLRGATTGTAVAAFTSVLAINTAPGSTLLFGHRAIQLDLQGFLAVIGSANLILAAVTREWKEGRLMLERRERQLRAIFEQAEVGIVQVSCTGTIELANRHLGVISGFQPEELVGQRVSRLMFPDEAFPLKPLSVHERRILRRDGQARWVRVNSTWLHPVEGREGTTQSLLCIFVDVTEEKRSKEEREALLASVTEALNQRNEFLSVASHELKTPLTTLLLQLQMILRQYGSTGAFSKAAFDKLRFTERQARRLVDLIEELLDISKILTNQLDIRPEPLELGGVVREVARSFAAVGEREKVAIVLEIEPGIVGTWDRSRLGQVVSNLLSNAIKFGASGGRVDLRVGRTADNAVLEVRDYGPGIAGPDQRRIFERFERAVSFRHVSGFGLGLYVTRKIVEAHGGTISVSSEAGRGALFTVVLPLRGARAGQAA